jgi:predicted RNase H-like nuclease
MHRDVPAVEDLPPGLVEQYRTRQRAADDRLDAVVAALNAAHDRNGLLSDDFPSL